MAKENSAKSGESLAIEIISKALKTPGVKVDRKDFLSKVFEASDPAMLNSIIELGPIEAGFDRAVLRKLAKGLVNKRTLESSGASFAAGIPGGIAMAGTIPADLAQFYAFALRLAQEIAYLYGMEDIWENGEIDSDKVLDTFMIYLGVMFGVSGASATLKAMSSALSSQALKKLPQKALMSTFYYPMIKSIAKFFGKNMTKEVFAKGVSKAIPVVGGLASGGLTLATMRPMGMRLVGCLDEARFEYTEEDFESDLEEIREVIEAQVEEVQTVESAADSALDFDEEITKAKRLLDDGVISEEEFADIKARIIANL